MLRRNFLAALGAAALPLPGSARLLTPVIITPTDAYGRPVQGDIDIGVFLKGHDRPVRTVHGDGQGARIVIADLGLADDSAAFRVMSLRSPAGCHRGICETEIRRGVENDIVLPHMIRLDHIERCDFDRAVPAAFQSVLRRSPRVAYETLDMPHRAGLHNIMAKSAAVGLADGNSVLGALGEIIEIRPDRIYAVVPDDLQPRFAQIAHLANGGGLNRLFHDPPRGEKHGRNRFVGGDSYKTPEARGLLNIRFYRERPAGRTIAEIDIDIHSGWFRHISREVAPHMLTGGKTSPFTIGQILAMQGIETGYRIVPKGLEIERRCGLETGHEPGRTFEQPALA